MVSLISESDQNRFVPGVIIVGHQIARIDISQEITADGLSRTQLKRK